MDPLKHLLNTSNEKENTLIQIEDPTRLVCKRLMFAQNETRIGVLMNGK